MTPTYNGLIDDVPVRVCLLRIRHRAGLSTPTHRVNQAVRQVRSTRAIHRRVRRGTGRLVDLLLSLRLLLAVPSILSVCCLLRLSLRCCLSLRLRLLLLCSPILHLKLLLLLELELLSGDGLRLRELV